MSEGDGETVDDPPSAAEAAKKWSKFMTMHDELRGLVKSLAAENKALRKEVQIIQENQCDLIQLGEVFIQGLQTLLDEDVSVSTLKSFLGSTIKNFFDPYKKTH